MIDFTILETSRLVLKGISPECMTEIFKLPKDEAMLILGHRTESDYQKELDKEIKGYSSYNRSFLLFLLIDKNSSTVIGRCGLHNWNKDHARAEIGYVMELENYKRKGLMSEAVAAILDFAFSNLNLNRVEALVSESNIPSLKILEKSGFTLEGKLRKHYLNTAEFENSLMFSMLREEFFGRS